VNWRDSIYEYIRYLIEYIERTGSHAALSSKRGSPGYGGPKQVHYDTEKYARSAESSNAKNEIRSQLSSAIDLMLPYCFSHSVPPSLTLLDRKGQQPIHSKLGPSSSKVFSNSLTQLRDSVRSFIMYLAHCFE
jgi:hypothetical protein